ncbi:heparinase II/III family protein [Ornithinimicrobium faecis]|uniref:heparinase II/III family protein n=1 Tax=Ornithinimicrobium faecis TaxID=2934158 RepID=UPI0021177F46|nr:heparinase II/III family protein [Ornithinimicrobium sp. HY1745]
MPPHRDWTGDLTDWTADPYANRNWTFQHHTLRWLNPVRHLAQEGDQAARDYWVTVVESWAKANTPPKRAESRWAWRHMVDGTRAIQLALGSPLMTDQDEWFVPLLENHRAWLSEPKNIVLRNHGMHQLSGLFVVSATLRDPEGMETARQRLADMFRKSFDEEGVNDEGSTGYHRLNLAWWEQAWQRVRLEGMEIPHEVAMRLDRAATVLAHFTQPDGFLPQIGDTKHEAVRGTITQKHLQFAATCGEAGEAPAETARVFSRGYITSRSGWGGERGTQHSHMLVRHGADLPGHSHQDRGAVHLYTAGRRWLVDGGFFNYQENDPTRRFTLGRQAHSVAFLPELDYRTEAEVTLIGQSVTKDWHDFTLLDKGYADYRLIRRVSYLTGPDLWIVHDQVESTEPVTLAHRWLVDTGIRPARHDRGFVLQGREGRARLDWLGRLPQFELHRATKGDLRGWVGTAWETLKPGSLITAKIRRVSPRLVTMFSGQYGGPSGIVNSYVSTQGVLTLNVSRGDSVWGVTIGSESISVALNSRLGS